MRNLQYCSVHTRVILAHIQTVGIRGLHRVHQHDMDRAFRMLVAGWTGRGGGGGLLGEYGIGQALTAPWEM